MGRGPMAQKRRSVREGKSRSQEEDWAGKGKRSSRLRSDWLLGRRLPSKVDDQQQRALRPAGSMWRSVLLRRLKDTARRARHSEAPPPASRMTRRAGLGGGGGAAAPPVPRSWSGARDSCIRGPSLAWATLSIHTGLETLLKSS